MKGLESGKDKVKKICEVLKKETIEPALREAEDIVKNAQVDAEKIIEEARAKAQMALQEARKQIEREKNVFQSSLGQACKQSLEQLRQEIEENLFNKELSKLVDKQSSEPGAIAEIITAVIKAIDKDGIEADLSAYVSSSVPASSVNRLLASQIINRLRDKGVLLANIQGGVCVKLHNQNITIDISDAALKDLVSRYIRKDFREMLFAAK
jgi:V/A-type H+-transporting ATPase subunit E